MFDFADVVLPGNRTAVIAVPFCGMNPRLPTVVVLAAADRDPQRFAAPDTLDLARRDNQHLGYGHGIHYCLGAALARMEARIFLTELLARTPEWDVTGAPEWTPSTLVRGMRALPLCRASMAG